MSVTIFQNNNFGKPYKNCPEGCSVPKGALFKCNKVWPWFFPNACPSLTNILNDSSDILYPSSAGNTTCTMLLLANMVHPEWINIKCLDNLLIHFVCFEKLTQRDPVVNVAWEICNPQQIKLREKCLSFEWPQNPGQLWSKPTRPFNVSNLHEISFIFVAFQSNLPLLQMTDMEKLVVLKCHKVIFQLKCIHLVENGMNHQRYLVGESNQLKMQVRTSVLKCSDGTFISSYHRCDGIVDCPNDDSDEEGCLCNKSISSLLFCKQIVDKVQRRCGPFYYQAISGNCEIFGFTQNISAESDYIPLPNCEQESILRSSLYNDLVVDCVSKRDEEEHVSIQMLTHGEQVTCSDAREIQCFRGHSRCFNLTDICVYSLSKFKHLHPCRNGGHMSNCTAFVCNLHFKCPRSYCVPWSYVCDGKWDCSEGEDESFCSEAETCRKLFKCRYSSRCLHLEHVCNSQTQCPYVDDEYFCQFSETVCPSGCACLGKAMQCIQWSFLEKFKYKFLSVSFSKLLKPLTGTNLEAFATVIFLSMSYQSVLTVCNLQKLSELLYLKATHNNVENLGKYCFCGHQRMKYILLDMNHISSVSCMTFANMSSLHYLSLAHNPLSTLPENFIVNSPVIFLSLVHVNLSLIEDRALQDILLKLLSTSDYVVCCFSHENSHCSAEIPWFASCSSLLPTTPAKITFITVSAIVALGNVASFGIHCLTMKSQKIFSFTVMLLNTADLLCAIYLGIIWTNDQIFEGHFILKNNWWRSSVPCFFAFHIFLWFSVLSSFMLLSMSISRLMVVVSPMQTSFKRTKFVLHKIIYIFGFTFTFSLSLSLIMAFLHAKIPWKLCSPFLDPTKQSITIFCLAWLVFVLQTVLSVVICALRIVLVIKVVQSQKKVQKSGGPDSFVSLIIQLTCLSLSNVISWYPTNIFNIVFTLLNSYPTKLVIWLTATVMPTNYLITPLILAGFGMKRIIKESVK